MTAVPIANVRANVCLRSTFGVDRDLSLLPHFVRHYQRYEVEDFRIILHAREANSGNLQRAHEILKNFGIKAAGVWITTQWNTGENSRRLAQIVESLPLDSWIISADSDEFHCFPSSVPCLISELAVLGYDAATGRLVDRVTADWRLRQLRDNQDIFSQFPIEADFFFRAPGNQGKVPLHRRSVLTTPGHHGIANIENVRVFPHAIKVAHFKWYDGVSRKYTDPLLIAHHSESWEYPIYSQVIDRNFNGTGRIVNLWLHSWAGKRFRSGFRYARRFVGCYLRRGHASG